LTVPKERWESWMARLRSIESDAGVTLDAQDVADELEVLVAYIRAGVELPSETEDPPETLEE